MTRSPRIRYFGKAQMEKFVIRDSLYVSYRPEPVAEQEYLAPVHRPVCFHPVRTAAESLLRRQEYFNAAGKARKPFLKVVHNFLNRLFR